MKIKKGDTVKVLYGKDAGKTGKVARVIPKKNMVIVEGVNMFKRNLKGDGRNRQSEIVNITKPLPAGKVQLLVGGKPTRVGYKIEDGKKVRIAVKTGKSVGSAVSEAKSEKVEPVKKTTKKPGI